MSLTKVDLKVLCFACLNGVQEQESAIAKRLRLKPSTVGYCLRKMRKENIILGYRYRVNYSRLGLSTSAWVLLKLKPAYQPFDKIFEELLLYPEVHVVSFITGEFDLALKVIERNVFSVDRFVREISKRFEEEIESAEILIVTKCFKFHNIAFKEKGGLSSFDTTDFKVLDQLMRFPDKGLVQIAQQLGLHRNTVSKRVKKLWREDVLSKKTPVINPMHFPELKIALKAIVLIDAGSEACTALSENLEKMPQVHELNRLLGRFKLMAIIRAASIPEFFQLLKVLPKKAGQEAAIKKTVSFIMLHSKPHKPGYLPQLLEKGLIAFKKGKIAC